MCMLSCTCSIHVLSIAQLSLLSCCISIRNGVNCSLPVPAFIFILVTAPPTITYPTAGSTISVREYKTYQLQCAANGNPQPNLMYNDPSNQTQEEFRAPADTNLAPVNSNLTLSFANITRRDAGKYTCTASNNFLQQSPQRTSAVTIDVQCECAPLESFSFV